MQRSLPWVTEASKGATHNVGCTFFRHKLTMLRHAQSIPKRNQPSTRNLPKQHQPPLPISTKPRGVPLPRSGYTFDSARLASATQPTLGNGGQRGGYPQRGLYFLSPQTNDAAPCTIHSQTKPTIHTQSAQTTSTAPTHLHQTMRCAHTHRGYTFDSAGLASATQPTLGNGCKRGGYPQRGLYFLSPQTNDAAPHANDAAPCTIHPNETRKQSPHHTNRGRKCIAHSRPLNSK